MLTTAERIVVPEALQEEINAALAEVDAAFEQGRLTVPETLASAQASAKGLNGPDNDVHTFV